MANILLPEPGRPQVLIEAAGETSILDIDPATIVALYKAHGALLLRGFRADIEISGLRAAILLDLGVQRKPRPAADGSGAQCSYRRRRFRAVLAPSGAVARAVEAGRGLLRLHDRPEGGRRDDDLRRRRAGAPTPSSRRWASSSGRHIAATSGARAPRPRLGCPRAPARRRDRLPQRLRPGAPLGRRRAARIDRGTSAQR